MWFMGILIIIWDFIVLPFRFIRDTFRWLGEVGERRSVSAEGDPELPFLNWIVVAGRAVLTLSALIGLIVAFIAGIVVLAQADDGSGAGLLFWVLGLLYIWGLVWAFAIYLELLYVVVRVPGQMHNILEEVKGLRADQSQQLRSSSQSRGDELDA